MHDFMPAGAAIPRATAMISVPAVMFIPSEVQPRIWDIWCADFNIKTDQIWWVRMVLWVRYCQDGVYVYYQGNIIHWTVLLLWASWAVSASWSILKAVGEEQAWSWMWTHAIMNIYLILQKTKAPGSSSALVILTWNECIMSYLSCFMPNVTCSAEQMTARLSLASVKARAAILRFNIAADIGWRKKLFCIPSSPAEDQHHTN